MPAKHKVRQQIGVELNFVLLNPHFKRSHPSNLGILRDDKAYPTHVATITYKGAKHSHEDNNHVTFDTNTKVLILFNLYLKRDQKRF